MEGWGGANVCNFLNMLKKKQKKTTKFDTHIRCQTDKVLRQINKWEAGSHTHTTAGLFIVSCNKGGLISCLITSKDCCSLFLVSIRLSIAHVQLKRGPSLQQSALLVGV